jgi:hypothetical protein
MTPTTPLYAETAELSSSVSPPAVPVGRTEMGEPPTRTVRGGPAIPVVDKPAMRKDKRVNVEIFRQVERLRALERDHGRSMRSVKERNDKPSAHNSG